MQIDSHVLVNVLLALGAALIVSFVATPLAKIFAERVGAVDVPKDSRRMHIHPIPRLGGLAIFLGFVLSVVLFAEVDTQVKGILLGSVIIVIVGVIDDITPLPAWIKLLVQVIAALVAVYFGIRIEILSNPNVWSENPYLNLGFLSIPITVIWIVGITNSVNLIDGLDGLAVGVSGIASVAILVICLILEQWNTAIILAALVGACIGFVPYNFHPAKIFMGDTGALLLGYVLATVSITGLLKFYAIISFVVPLLALGLPIFDTIFSIIRRLLRGQNPMAPDRGHVHHRLIDMGLSQKQAVAVLYSISAVLGISAVLIATSGEMKAIVLLFAFCVAIAIGVAIMNGIRADRERAEEESRKIAAGAAAAPVIPGASVIAGQGETADARSDGESPPEPLDEEEKTDPGYEEKTEEGPDAARERDESHDATPDSGTGNGQETEQGGDRENTEDIQ